MQAPEASADMTLDPVPEVRPSPAAHAPAILLQAVTPCKLLCLNTDMFP